MPLLQLPARAWLWWIAAVQVPAPPEAAGARWHAPAACPDRDALLTAVARRLGRPLGAGELEIDAEVVGDARRGFTLRLTLSAGARAETREVHDPSCAALVDAAALRVAAVLDPSPVVPPAPAAPEPRAEPPAPESPTPAATMVAPTPPLASAPVRSSVGADAPVASAAEGADARPGGVLRLQGGAELGAVPGGTGALGLALGLLWPRLRVELQGTFLAPRRASRPPGEVRVGLLAGAVHGCWRAGRGALEVPLCAGLELGALRGEARRLPGARTGAGWWVAAALGPGMAWQLGRRVSVWASLQLVLAALRPSFEQGAGAGAATIFRPSLASGRLLVGVELRLGDPW